LIDLAGVAGDAGDEPGLGLLPVTTHFEREKILRQVTAECAGQRWTAYEIHMGRTVAATPVEALQTVTDADGTRRPEGARRDNIWGTYLHGWFEAPELRARIAAAGGLSGHRAHPVPWSEQRQAIYTQMAAHVAAHVDLEPVRRALDL
jgi:adenosylcobyric acid synthase